MTGSQLENSDNSALRRQLEGGLEVLEAASSRYRELSTMLLGKHWKPRLRQNAALLEAALAEETSLPEVLTRLQRRAERELEGPGPASRFLRQFGEEREKLSHAMARRLSLNEGTLAERLGRLKAIVLKPLPLPPGEGELRLMEGSTLLLSHGASMVLVMILLLCALPVLNPHPKGWWLAVPLLGALWAFFSTRAGHYWLTSERLLWQPRQGDPVQVLLPSIGESRLRVDSSSSTVTVGAPGGLVLRHVPRASELAALLSIRRRKEFRDAAATRDVRRVVGLLEMYTAQPGEAPNTEGIQGGVAVLRPNFVAFFHDGAPGDILLDAITEPTGPSTHASWQSRDRIPVPIRLLIDQLLLLPEERMDALLRKAASFDTGTPYTGPQSLLWEVRELKWNRQGWTSLELSRGDKALWAGLDWQHNVVADHLIGQWKALQKTPESPGAEPPKA
jgi:hypothetical protein